MYVYNHVAVYSDACTGQNRNVKLTLMCMKAVQKQERYQYYSPKIGHSFLSNDADFGSVEVYAKTRTMFSRENWCTAIANARRNKSFYVTVMSGEDFKSTKTLSKQLRTGRSIKCSSLYLG
ncbi:hypothetical protein PR048_005182 [Dryococelus australis]|uniref:Uncharacterized protein n=1 Tax=Dryococelus australis TaxID=614101 RepID=A0ABQ9I7J4_9NEOP|nr:hypothetical protein PR048_005182 [Dryococelus australis]